MQRRNKNHQRKHMQKPVAVDEIAGYLALNIAFILFVTAVLVCFLLLILSQSGLVRLLEEFSQHTCIAVLLVALSVFLILLLRAFRRLRRWTYGYVEFILTWSSMRGIPGLREKLQQKDVRRAFGLTDQPDSVDEK